ncbi:hypothetical protein QOZ80_8AG0640590 [Eleusine coracana subsp. coracana]|nr:hypothetical protein QOZ80_8AG0640590 [Eleusine coracana subsp. coracana]
MAALSPSQFNALLDNLCATLQILKDETTPDFITEVITLFCNEGNRIIGQLTMLLQKPVVDFVELDIRIHQLKGCSSCVGANKVKDACVALRDSSKQKDSDGCRQKLEIVRHEFYVMRNKFHAILRELERQAPPCFRLRRISGWQINFKRCCAGWIIFGEI